MIYHKDGLKRPLVIRRVKELPNFIINNNLRTLNMTREEFEEIMDRL